jgi:hypothetical protein
MLYCRNNELKLDMNQFLGYYQYIIVDCLYKTNSYLEFEGLSHEAYTSFRQDQLQTWHLGCYGSKGPNVDTFDTYLRKLLKVKPS